MGGVEGFIITNGSGAILRQSKGMTAREAAAYAAPVLALTQRARHAVRDLDPKVSARRKQHALRVEFYSPQSAQLWPLTED